MTTLRAFIAIHLPQEVKDALGEVSRALGNLPPRGVVRWVRPEQMHLTLRFLGDTDHKLLPSIRQSMDNVASRNAPFTSYLSGVGCFPNMRRPRVIWVGLSGEETRLLALKTAIDQELAPLGWPPEGKPFHAHLTLGRIKDDRAAQGIEWTAEVPRLAVPVSAIHLIESDLKPDGPIYTNRHSSSLRG